MSRSVLIIVSMALISVVTEGQKSAFAQRTGGTTGGTTTGGTTTGGATTGSTGTTGGTGGSTFSYGLGATGTAGGTGTGGTGGATGTQGGLQGPQFVQIGDTQTQGAQGGFVGRGAGSTFIGAGLQGAQQTARQGQFGQAGGQFGNFGQFGGAGGGRGGALQRGGFGTTSTLSRAERMRPRHRIAFDFAPVEVDTVRTNLLTHIQPVQTRLEGINVDVDAQGLATLSGTAASEDARKLAEMLARLEPGIRKVNNEIEVVPAE